MEKIVKRYFQLKQQQKETEQELKELRDEIIGYCREQGTADFTSGPYRVKLVSQTRKEYDDEKLFEALPDLEVWKLLSKSDPAKSPDWSSWGSSKKKRSRTRTNAKRSRCCRWIG
ncbi:hypothetical protein CM49_05791 [Paenibacillus sp. P1XP2]|nr:hypothetical protein CM49_05791 [Paenibacillus sp. P1XP2]